MALARRQSQDTSQPKAPITPEQRKLYAGMGIAGVLFLLAGGLFLRSQGGSDPVLPPSPPPVTSGTNDGAGAPTGEPGAAPGAVPGGVAAPGQGAAPGGVAPAAAPAGPLARSRPDPFQQIYFIPTPTPTPPPLPPPVDVPLPNDVPPVLLPGSSVTSQQLQQPLNLPPVTIRRLDETFRRPVDAFPPRRTAGGEGGSGGAANPSTDKRLSGVIIGEGVRALLEIQGPTGTVTRVVQPGDEVEGITVLNIQRFNDGTRLVTRMIIRENGEERSVDLRAGVPVAPPGGGPGGLPPGFAGQ